VDVGTGNLARPLDADNLFDLLEAEAEPPGLRDEN